MNSYLIWSNEHGAWWRSNGFGYTLNTREAGRFSKEQAADDVQSAGAFGPDGVANEVMVLAPEHRWEGGPPESEDFYAAAADIRSRRHRFEHLPPLEAAIAAWTVTGPSIKWHETAVHVVSVVMPELAEALDRLAGAPE